MTRVAIRAAAGPRGIRLVADAGRGAGQAPGPLPEGFGVAVPGAAQGARTSAARPAGMPWPPRLGPLPDEAA